MRHSASESDREIRALRDALVAERDRQCVDTLANRGWLAVPFEIGPLVDRQLAMEFCRVTRALCDGGGEPVLVAVPLHPEQMDDADEIVEVPSVPDALEQWSVDYNWSDWLLTTRRLRYALICYGVYNFDVAVGPRRVVEDLLDTPVETALDAFEAFDRDYEYRPDKEQHLRELRMARMLLGAEHRA